jgi:hypothetical protein
MYGVVVKKEDMPAIIKAKKKFYAEGKNKKYEKRIRKTILPHVRKDIARQTFFKTFFRTTGSFKKNNLKFINFDFGIPLSSSFESVNDDIMIDNMSVIEHEQGLFQHVIECVDRFKKDQAGKKSMISKKSIVKPTTEAKPPTNTKFETVAKPRHFERLSNMNEAAPTSSSTRRPITRSSTRASLAAATPAPSRKPLVVTQLNGDELESESNTSDSNDTDRSKCSKVPAAHSPSGKLILQKEQARGRRGRGGRKK